MSNTINA